MKKKIIALAGIVAIIVLSCSKKSEDTLNTALPSDCDTVNMKYTANVEPILKTNCYPCHGVSTSSNSNGVLLEGYDNLKVRADDGELISVITHTPGYPAMPQGAPKLSDCDINIIRSWVNNGIQNN